MKYDYTFFRKHCSRKRKLLGGSVSTGLYDFNIALYEAISAIETRTNDVVITICPGAYTKDHTRSSLQALQKSLNTALPEDFLQFHQEFGEALLITRTWPIWLVGEERMIEEFEDDPDIDIEEGRFFRFATYPDASVVYYGLRKAEGTDHWQVVWCTHGLLYSEMIGPMGQESVVCDSFYEWLKRKVETDGFPDEVYLTEDQYGESID